LGLLEPLLPQAVTDQPCHRANIRWRLKPSQRNYRKLPISCLQPMCHATLPHCNWPCCDHVCSHL